jgi:hypothetical protein
MRIVMRIVPGGKFLPGQQRPASNSTFWATGAHASELTGRVRLTRTGREAARADNEQEDEMKPKQAANPACFGPRSSGCRVGTP